MNRSPTVESFGDAAVLIVLGEGIDEATSARVHRLAAALEDGPFGRPIPAYASLLVPVDPLDPGVERAADELREIVTEVDRTMATPLDQGPPIELHTRYGGIEGPDLDEVAEMHDLRPQQVVEIHAATDYRVYFLGFAPGFAYLGRVAPEIATPRLGTPRERVPAGSVGIAGEQTAVYPVDSPGGWRLIGRTDTRVWDPTRDPPALLVPGRRVRFVPLRD